MPPFSPSHLVEEGPPPPRGMADPPPSPPRGMAGPPCHPLPAPVAALAPPPPPQWDRAGPPPFSHFPGAGLRGGGEPLRRQRTARHVEGAKRVAAFFPSRLPPRWTLPPAATFAQGGETGHAPVPQVAPPPRFIPLPSSEEQVALYARYPSCRNDGRQGCHLP